MLNFILEPLSNWFGVTSSVFLLSVIALFSIINVVRG